MWLVYDAETGEQIGELLMQEPTNLPEGQSAVQVPGSALVGVSEWRPAVRGFVDVPRKGREELLALFTTEELALMVQAGPLEIIRLVLALSLVRVPIRSDEPFFVAGVTQAAATAIPGGGGSTFLSEARAAAILAFQPPA